MIIFNGTGFEVKHIMNPRGVLDTLEIKDVSTGITYLAECMKLEVTNDTSDLGWGARMIGKPNYYIEATNVRIKEIENERKN